MKDCFPIRKKGLLTNPVCCLGGAHLSRELASFRIHVLFTLDYLKGVQLMKLLNRFFPVSTRKGGNFVQYVNKLWSY